MYQRLTVIETQFRALQLVADAASAEAAAAVVQRAAAAEAGHHPVVSGVKCMLM